MRFHQHHTNNQVLGAPTGWDQDKIACNALPVTLHRDESGELVMASFWRPEPEELALLNQGKSVVLFVHGTSHPVVSVGVSTE